VTCLSVNSVNKVMVYYGSELVNSTGLPGVPVSNLAHVWQQLVLVMRL